MKFRFALIASMCLSATSFGQTAYVDGTCGNDTWTGTSRTCAAPNGPKRTIHAAIPPSGGVTIIVAAGVYEEQVLIIREHFGNSTITIQSESGAAVTTIDALGGSGAVSASSIIDGNGRLVVRDFTIRNADVGVSNGDRIALEVSGCVITDCGIGMNVTGVRASSCVFENNLVDGLRSQFSFPTAIELDHCIFRGNAERAINTNTAVTLVNSLVAFNGTTTERALSIGRRLTLRNVTVVENTGLGVAVVPVGFDPSATLNAYNSIVWDNNGGGGQISVSGSNPTANVQYCIVQGGFMGTGNLSSDPLFENPTAGDFRVGSGSPAIDSGYAFQAPRDQNTDLDGQPRISDNPAVANTGEPFPTYLDRGAYESAGRPYCVGDMDDDHDVEIDDLAILLSQFGTSAAALPGDHNRDGVVDIGDLATLLSNFGVVCP